jgi:tetratricopeptide (TPR) repeat protein
MTEQGTIELAIQKAIELLNDNLPDLAEKQLQEILELDGSEVKALRLMGVIHLSRNEVPEAIECLEKAVLNATRFHQAKLDLATAYRRSNEHKKAERLLRKLTRQVPDLTIAWHHFGDLLIEIGKIDAGRTAFSQAIVTDIHAEDMKQAMQYLMDGRAREAETIFRSILEKDQNHLRALIGLASIAVDAGSFDDAERLLRQALSISPHLDRIWIGLTRIEAHKGHYHEAETCARKAVAFGPDNPESWTRLGIVLAWVLKTEEAKDALEKSLSIDPNQPQTQIALGHVLKTLGDNQESVQAYRRSIVLQPRMGEAYWSLADLKTYHFTEQECSEMKHVLGSEPLDDMNRAAFHFALGWAHEDQGEYEASFKHYESGNAIKHQLESFDAERFLDKVSRTKTFFSKEESFTGTSYIDEQNAVPIFIVGLPRSGSTLVEQILASHSLVQGTMELPHILNYAAALDATGEDGNAYPEALAELSQERLSGLGNLYLKETEVYRRDSHFFTDKMPNNYFHVGLIHLMLPQAVIVDVRRNPMDCCFSLYKQNFAQGQAFSNRLEDLALYYNEYVGLMEFWERVLPGRVLRIEYESLVKDSESEIRGLLAHCGLEFESSCLKFYETERSVRTASAEQVRQPIYDKRVHYWQKYEGFLEPLQSALGLT